MLISENKHFRQEVNADQRHGSFSAHFQLVLYRNKPIPETHTKRKATQDGCLPTAQLAGRWGKRNWNSERWGKNIVLGRLEQPSQNKNFLYRYDKPNEPLSFVLFRVTIHLSFNSQQGTPLSSLWSLVLDDKIKTPCQRVFTENESQIAYLPKQADSDVSEQGLEWKGAF